MVLRNAQFYPVLLAILPHSGKFLSIPFILKPFFEYSHCFGCFGFLKYRMAPDGQ